MTGDEDETVRNSTLRSAEYTSASLHNESSIISPVIRRQRPYDTSYTVNGQGEHLETYEIETGPQLTPFLLDFHNNNNTSIEGLIKYL